MIEYDETASLKDKLALIKKAFEPFIGKELSHYETAYLYEDKCGHEINNKSHWEYFADMPIFLCFEENEVLSVCWENFDDLIIKKGRQLNFSPVDYILWWQAENVSGQQPKLNEVYLASDRMFLGKEGLRNEEEWKIWIHLFLTFDNGKILEISCALDENEIHVHDSFPELKYESILAIS